MALANLTADAPVRIDVMANSSDERAACERALARAGIRLPLPHRAAWAKTRPAVRSLLVALRGADGDWAAAVGMHAAASRALPGFRLLRVERFGETVPRALWRAAVDALTEVARREPRVLRLSVEVFSRDDSTRAGLGELLARNGFKRATARNWETTLALDLQPREEDLFASLSPTARRAIRGVAKHPVQIRLIDDRHLAPRMEALSIETFARTGGHYQSLWDWAGVIELSRDSPDASRLVGLFRTDRQEAEALLGFAWGCWNGQSVSYFTGASTRPKDLRRIGIVYPLFWDLIRWAKQAGATWFDLGGVTPGGLDSGDPVGGISDFKRLFSKETVNVAEDWVLEPHPIPARLAGLVSSAVAWLRRAARR
ncbi:MAG TPA: GNAT family N-acetyltransferase [Gemmatimonadales bacterium]|nr:GNAT family N-acetyltransferase [Gemmatimonadales bacterium]